MKIGLVVPVLTNFPGLAELIESVDTPVLPLVIDNWTENRGVSGGWNLGIRRAIDAGCDAVVVSGDDVVLYPGTIEKLMDGLEHYDLVTASNRRDHAEGESGYVPNPDFSCFSIKVPSFVEKFGFFDEHFSPAYFEDNDMARRIDVLGGTQMQRLDAGMMHAGSVTQFWNGGRVVSHEQFEINRSYYCAKWGGWPGDERFDRPFDGMTGRTAKDW